jgi:hypothetical protein
MGIMRGVGGPQDEFIESGIQAREAAMEAQLELVQQFRTCSKCAGDRFSERPVTKKHPADAPDA